MVRSCSAVSPLPVRRLDSGPEPEPEPEPLRMLRGEPPLEPLIASVSFSPTSRSRRATSDSTLRWMAAAMRGALVRSPSSAARENSSTVAPAGAVTVAERGSASTNAISPTTSPGPRRATTSSVPASVRTVATRCPSSTIMRQSPRSPSLKSASPGAPRRAFSTARTASHSSSARSAKARTRRTISRFAGSTSRGYR